MNTPDDATRPINLGNPHEFTIRELAELVIEETGSSSKLESNPLPVNDPRRRQPDIQLAREKLGWAGVELNEGLEATVRYFDQLLKDRG
jgi:UDP-glucuronate decarboxylase